MGQYQKWQCIQYMPSTPLGPDGRRLTAGPEHIALSREAAQSLRIRKNCCIFKTENIALIDTDQGIQHGRIFECVLFRCQPVFFRSTLQEPAEYFRSESKRKDDATHTGRG